ncbi:MAG: type I secretion system permease/ATPase [Rhodospirillales bacterium]|nr:type I secretion system permease/ATPase [Rhodospirillales bacterium]MCB9964658.1 type I secretion system permease/ATPase [Rhodospirillales bacterium]MCB9979948.1 type I secretion system permease/ATPase [Rhodospirillales bacterium]
MTFIKAFSVEQNSSDPSVNSPDSSQKAAQKPSATHPDKWPLEADRLAIHQPLVACLQLIAGHYGRRTSINALTAGLPLPRTGITPTLFERAAGRADLAASLMERSLESLAIAPNLPCILVLKDGQACILWEVIEKPAARNTKPGILFRLQLPETATERQDLSLDKLRSLYDGYAYFIRPVARIDERAGPAEIDTTKDWFKGTLLAHKSLYMEVILAALLINLFALVSPLFVMNVYDRVLPHKAIDTLWVLAVGIFTVYLFDFVLKNLRAQFLDHAGRSADVKISAALFEQVMGMTMAARPASAGVMASHMKEFETLRDFFTSGTMAALVDLPFTIIFVLLIYIIGGPMALVSLLAIPVVIGIGLLLQGPMQKVIRQSMNESALKNALLFETITGLETIKSQAAESHAQRRWEELTDKSSRTAIKSRKLAAYATNGAIFIQQLAGVIVVIVGVYLVSMDNSPYTMGSLIACVILTGRALAPLAQVAGLMTRLNQSREALKHLDAMMKKPVERPAGKHFISIAHVKGQIDFKDVIFKYPGQTRPALNGVSFSIDPGEHIGVIGAVGSGKTTVERLLHNLFQPDSGTVQLDGTDVRQIDPGDLRRNIGVVQQSPQLFYGSIRENITMGHEMATENAVLRAAEMAGVMEFIRDSETGLDTPVGERGEALSGGQRQAVAVARALLYDPSVLILDEPTASMDPASENRLRQRLEQITEGRTILLITHKGAMLTLVDKLILMDKGKMIAYGPKDEIIRRLQAREFGTDAENTKV